MDSGGSEGEEEVKQEITEKKSVKKSGKGGTVSDRSCPPWCFKWSRDGVIAPTEALDKDPVPIERRIYSCSGCNELFAFEETLQAHRTAFCRKLKKGFTLCPYDKKCGPVQNNHLSYHKTRIHNDEVCAKMNFQILRPEFVDDILLLDSFTTVSDLPGMPRPRHGFISFMHPDLPVPQLIYEYLQPLPVVQIETRYHEGFVMDRMLHPKLMIAPTSYSVPGYDWGHGAAYCNHAHALLEKNSTYLSCNAILQNAIANQLGISKLEDLAVRIRRTHHVRIYTGPLIEAGATSIIAKWIMKIILYQDPHSKNYYYDAWKLPNTDAADSVYPEFRTTVDEINSLTGWNLLNKINPTREDLMKQFPITSYLQMKLKLHKSENDPRFIPPADLPTKEYMRMKKLEDEILQLRNEKLILAQELATLIVENMSMPEATSSNSSE